MAWIKVRRIKDGANEYAVLEGTRAEVDQQFDELSEEWFPWIWSLEGEV